MSTILVVDDMPICREPIEAALRNAGYATKGASSGKEALVAVATEHPDLVLLDFNMPEMDGLAVLRAIRKNPQLQGIKVVFLTDSADRQHILEAGRLGIQGYLLKSQFSLETMLAHVKHALDGTAGGTPLRISKPTNGTQETQPADASVAPADRSGTGWISRIQPPATLDGLSPVISKGALRKLISDGLELKPLGPSVHSVIRATSSPHCCADDVAHAVGQDQALSVRILKLANSSVYGRGRPVETVREAVTRIGVREVRNLVMALGVVTHYEGPITDYVDPRLFWEHSVGCGLIAAAIARHSQRTAVEDAFLWGMLHDVGRLVILDHSPDEYTHVFEEAGARGLPVEVVEPKMMWVDHCEILAQALERWKFPKELAAPTVGHHRSDQQIKRGGTGADNALGIIALANRIAHALLLGNSGNDTLYPVDELFETLGLNPSILGHIAQEVPEECNALKFSMIAQSTEGTWPDYVSDVKQRLETGLRPLCYSPQPSLDVFRMFCERIADHADDGTPNLGVIYAGKDAANGDLFTAYEAQEQESECGRLPLVVIVNGRAVEQSHSVFAERHHTILNAPVRVKTFVDAANELLG